MKDNLSSPVAARIYQVNALLSPKARLLADFILSSPQKAVFMTSRELAETCDVSEATVIRFVNRIGYDRYSDYIQSLRDFMDSEMTLPDRTRMVKMNGNTSDRLWRIINQEMDNLERFYQSADPDILNRVIEQMHSQSPIYVIGARVSFTFAYYMGWSLTKIRPDTRILDGSNSTTVDYLSMAPPSSLVIIITTSRYPKELVHLGKLARQFKLTLLVITDSQLCPLIPLADLSLVAPSKHIPFIGAPATITSITNYLVMELADMDASTTARHQQKLEKTYLENDILYNPPVD